VSVSGKLRLRRLCAAAAACAALLVAGCRGEAPTAEQRYAGQAPPPTTADPGGMAITVAEVRADPSLDAAAVRAALRGAETALLWCVETDGSTGLVVMRLAIEKDGSVAEIRLRETTTYGSEDARACMKRIVGAMRFPSLSAGRADVEIALEVRARSPGRPRDRALSPP
jgi:hypothetical protein